MKKTKFKAIVLVICLLLLGGAVIGGTLAFLTASDDAVENVFTPSKVTTSVTENFTDGVKSNVKIQNTGDTEAYIRAAVIVTWQDTDGNVYGEAPKASDYSITYNLAKQENPAGQWELIGDYYYWSNPVAAGGSTGILITECELNEGVTPPSGYNLCVEIICSGIQAGPDAAVNAWKGVQVNE